MGYKFSSLRKLKIVVTYAWALPAVVMAMLVNQFYEELNVIMSSLIIQIQVFVKATSINSFYF